MKRHLSPLGRTSLICAAVLTVCCGIFAAAAALIASHPDPQNTSSALRNPLDGAKNGVSILLRASQTGNEYFSANQFPTLNGAKGDGVSNDTKYIQESLQAAAGKGGTVYLPQGIYRITEPLTIPFGVTLRGDFSAPDSKTSGGAKTILLVADNKEIKSAPLLTIENGASLIGITVYYEKQTPQKRIEYPSTVYCKGNASLRQISLLNPYHGICINGAGTVEISSVWISPLDYGLLIENNNASVTVEDLSVSPSYWLNYAPQIFADGTGYPKMTQYLHENMHGLILEQVSDVTLNRIFVEDAFIGILFNVPWEQDSLLLASEISISNTDRPVYIQSLPSAGLCFADCTFQPDNEAGADTIEIGPEAKAPITFSSCTFAGLPKTVIKADNSSFISFYHCSFGTWWDVCFDVESDTFLAVSPTFRTKAEKASLGKNAFGLLYNADTIEESSNLLFSVPPEKASQTTSNSVPALKDTQSPFSNAPVLNGLDFGVSTAAADNTAALTKALEEAEKENGIVFLPEGNYNFQSIITIPESVRLIGAGNTGSYCTTLSFDLQQSTNFSLVELKSSAGVENLAIRQASSMTNSQNTYAISSMYPNARICRVSLSAGRGIWLTTTQNAVLEHISMAVTETGLHLQKMSKVTVRDLKITDPSGSFGTTGMKIEDSSIAFSGLHTTGMNQAIVVTENSEVTGTLLTLRSSSVGVCGAQTGNILLTTVGCSDLGKGGGTVFLQAADTMTGKLTVQGMLCAGKALLGNLLLAENGTTLLQAAILTPPFPTSIVASQTAKVSVFGCIWNNIPTYHASAAGGNVLLAANMIRSDQTFEGIEGKYMQTEVQESGGTIQDSANIIQYVYIEPEDGGEESTTIPNQTPSLGNAEIN